MSKLATVFEFYSRNEDLSPGPRVARHGIGTLVQVLNKGDWITREDIH